ncbi:MAG: hypothetical protein V7K55_14515 [Nostoc sp.]|uniref:hypothetical protein n=1 Tax=Nostoc sp. TaxID=1180 RepID=UPI002FF571CA
MTTAERLLKQQQQRHQGQSDKWYFEKVIYDLARSPLLNLKIFERVMGTHICASLVKTI